MSSFERQRVGDTVPGSSIGAQITSTAQHAVPPALAYIHPLGNGGPQSYGLSEYRHHTPSEVERRKPPPIMLPPFSTLLSLIPPRIPPEPRITLSFLGAERLQLADAALGGLEMKLYVIEYACLPQIGLTLPSAD